MLQQDLRTPTMSRHAFTPRAVAPAGYEEATIPGLDRLRQITDAFNAVGGIASGEEIAILLRRHCDQPLSQLARWIVGGNIVSFEWRGQTLIPLFQFDLDEMTVKPEVSAVLAVLARRRLGNDGTCLWLTTPNPRLDGCKPIDCISSDLPAVLQAARAESSETAR